VGLFNPIVEQIGSGVNLILTPTISADKKYVGLNVEVIQTNLLSFVALDKSVKKMDYTNPNRQGAGL